MTSPDTEALVNALHGFKPLELLDEIDVENIEQAVSTIQSLAATIAEQADQINAAREFVKRHPALTLIDLAEFEAFLKLPAAYDAALLRAMQKEART